MTYEINTKFYYVDEPAETLIIIDKRIVGEDEISQYFVSSFDSENNCPVMGSGEWMDADRLEDDFLTGVYRKVEPMIYGETDTKEIALLAAVIAHNCFDRIMKKRNAGAMDTFDTIAKLAEAFHKNHRHVTEWAEWVNDPEQQIKATDWEDYTIAWAMQSDLLVD